MAKSRQQLINASSFLSNQKEQIGGLNVKRSTITADSFKKGTSQESSDNIEGRVGANEKKITLLKNIVKLRKQNVDKQLKSEVEDKPQQMGSPLLESLQSIASTVDSIRDTLIQQQDNDKGVAESMRREREEKDRQSQEKKLEKPKILQKFADPIIKPVMSIWSKILNFIKTLFLGKILMNFIDWFANPANQGKIQTLVRFVKDWWPALTAAVLLFGTGFGGLVAGLIKTIMWFIPAMGKAIAFMKSAKFMSMIPGKGKVGKLLTAGALVGGGMLLGNAMSGGDDEQQEQPQGFNKGGKVPGSGNKDTVPAMLTPGEFVMSKGAVEQYGVGTLAGMNAAAGGTNVPVLMPDKKRKGYNEGGPVMGYGMGEIMPDQFVFNKTEFKKKITTRERNGEIVDHNVEKSFTDIGGSIGMPDLIEHQTQLVESLRQVPGYEDINFMDVVQYPDGQGRLVDMEEETLYPILNASDAAKATSAKQREASQRFLENNDLINPDGSVKGYSYYDGKITVDGETKDAVLADGAIQQFSGGGLVNRIQPEDLTHVNAERALQGLPPLDKLTYAAGVTPSVRKGPDPKTSEYTDTHTDLETMVRTITKTVNGETTRESFKLSNEEAEALLKQKGYPSMTLADGSVVIDSASYMFDKSVEMLRNAYENGDPKKIAEFNADPDFVEMWKSIEDGSLREEVISNARMHKKGTKENLMQKNMNRIEEMDGGEGVELMNFNGGGLVQYLNNGGKVSEMPPKEGFEGWETYNTSGMKGVVTREPSDYKPGIMKFTLPDGTVQYETIPSLFDQAKSRRQDRRGSTNKQGGGFKRMVGGAADFVTGGMFDFDKRNRKGAPKDFGINRMAGGLTDWATMGLTDFDKRGKGNLQFDPIGGGKDKAWGVADEQAKRGEKQSGMGIKRGIGGALDFMTLGAFDFDKQNPEGSPKGFGPARMMGGIADWATMGLTDFDQRGAGNFQFNPIGGGDNKKWEIGPKKPKNSIIAYEQEVKNNEQNQQSDTGGNEIPKFTLRPSFMIDQAKVDVLGIVV